MKYDESIATESDLPTFLSEVQLPMYEYFKPESVCSHLARQLTKQFTQKNTEKESEKW